MANINVMFGRETIQKLQLTGKNEFLIGRNEFADIILDNLLVSRKHALIKLENGVWVVQDLSGKNGVIVNRREVGNARLKNGDKIEIAKYMLHFAQGRDELEKNVGQAFNKPGAGFKTSFDEMAADASGEDQKQNETFGNAKTKIDSSDSTMQASPEQLAKLRSEMSTRRKAHLVALKKMDRKVYPLSRNKISIGKGADADIIIKGGFTVGKIQAVLNLQDGKWWIEHKSGFSATKVNGKKLDSRQPLEDGDEIEIGSSKMKFQSKL